MNLGVARSLLALLTIGSLLSLGLPLVSSRSLGELHTALDTAALVLGIIAGLQLLGMFRRSGRRLELLVALVLFVTAVTEALHVVAGVLWTDASPLLLQDTIPNLRPFTWSTTAVTRAVGFIAALLLARRSPPVPWGGFLGGLALLLMASLGVFTLTPTYMAPGWLGISRPSLIVVPLCWAAVMVMGWRARHDDRLMFVLGAGALPFFIGHSIMLYSSGPDDTFGMMAHLAKMLGYVFLVVTLSWIDSQDASEVVSAGRLLRERTEELEATNQRILRESAERARAQDALRESEEVHRTDRRLRDRALASSEALLQAVLANLTEAICVMDPAGNFLYANAAVLRLYGLTDGGRPLAEIVRDLDARRQDVELVAPDGTRSPMEEWPSARARRGDFVRNQEFGVHWKDSGQTAFMEFNTAPIRGETGEIVQIVVSYRDVTVQKAAKDAIRQMNTELERRVEERTRALEEVNRELEAFSYSVSHDLRAPLRHVQGYVQLLAAAVDGELSPEAKRHLKVIADASIEMGQLIDDLLDFSRVGRTELRADRVQLDELVQEVINTFQVETHDRNVVWRVEPLPATLGDRAMLRQVLSNLLANAVKYTRPRDPAVIEIGQCAAEDGRSVLFVRDNGVGFDMRYAHKLFGVFQRLHKASEFEGTGIGLATVQRIVARHGGRVWALGDVNAGATFFFTLPAASPPQPSLMAEQPA